MKLSGQYLSHAERAALMKLMPARKGLDRAGRVDRHDPSVSEMAEAWFDSLAEMRYGSNYAKDPRYEHLKLFIPGYPEYGFFGHQYVNKTEAMIDLMLDDTSPVRVFGVNSGALEGLSIKDEQRLAKSKKFFIVKSSVQYRWNRSSYVSSAKFLNNEYLAPLILGFRINPTIIDIGKKYLEGLLAFKELLVKNGKLFIADISVHPDCISDNKKLTEELNPDMVCIYRLEDFMGDCDFEAELDPNSLFLEDSYERLRGHSISGLMSGNEPITATDKVTDEDGLNKNRHLALVKRRELLAHCSGADKAEQQRLVFYAAPCGMEVDTEDNFTALEIHSHFPNYVSQSCGFLGPMIDNFEFSRTNYYEPGSGDYYRGRQRKKMCDALPRYRAAAKRHLDLSREAFTNYAKALIDARERIHMARASGASLDDES